MPRTKTMPRTMKATSTPSPSSCAAPTNRWTSSTSGGFGHDSFPAPAFAPDVESAGCLLGRNGGGPVSCLDDTTTGRHAGKEGHLLIATSHWGHAFRGSRPAVRRVGFGKSSICRGGHSSFRALFSYWEKLLFP